jgi:hypothetical protein
MKKLKRTLATIAGLALVAGTTVACSTTTPEAMCAFVVGSGGYGNDTKLHKIVLPGDSLGSLEDEVARFVPCNARNYKTNDGTVKVNQGDHEQRVGDRFTPSMAYTKEGTPVRVWSDSYWTLNQTESVLRTFYEVCYKYTCFSTDDSSGGANFSTPGWNGLLAENFGPTVDEIALAAMAEVGDDIWRKQDAELRTKVAKLMSEKFAAAMQRKFGINEDIFCGSGNSGWDSERKNFNCTQVRFEVPRVDRHVPSSNEATATPESLERLNADRLKVAKALYGESAGYWLGVQDAIAACRQSPTPCQINIGSAPSAAPMTPIK